MRLNPRLIHKLLIVVAIPVVFQVGFLMVVMDLLQKAEDAAAREHRAREAVASLNSIYERVMETSRAVGGAVLSRGNAPSTLDFHQITATLPGDLANLKEQLNDNRAAIEGAERLEQTLNATLRIIDEVFSQLQAGDRLPAMHHLRDLRGAIPDIITQLNDLRQQCSRIADVNFDVDHKTRMKLRSMIRYGVFINIIIAAALALYINRHITSRLSVVMENTRRLVKGQELLPKVSGSDEIAHLDRIFKDMATALEMAHKKEHAIIDTMPAGLIITDGQGNIQMINPTTMRLLEYEQEELTGSAVANLFSRSKITANEDLFAELRAKAEDRIDERVVKRKSGTLFPVELSITSFTVFADTYWLIVMLDITERKEIEQMKQEFVSMVSHDLRTPLTSIQVFLNMLSRGMLGQVSEPVQKKATMADRNVGRLIRLINDLLDIDKMDSGQLDLALENTTLQSALERSVDSVKAYADQQSIAIECAPCSTSEVSADPDRLVQVMVNLVGNAIKFSPKSSIINIAMLEDADWLTVQIIDHGRGVPDKLRDSIFERFKQVEKKDATEKNGTGLGLAICKAIVVQHGGAIGVDSVEGEGSTFWFRLPKVKTMVALTQTTSV